MPPFQTFASICSGGAVIDQGAHAAGLTPLWGVEIDPAIAAVAQDNTPSAQIITAAAQDVDYTLLPRADVLHASPPCPNFSNAKTKAEETAIDEAIASAINRAIGAQRPQLFTLENVQGYIKSQSLKRIMANLHDLDYATEIHVLNSADYGVPQTRIRMFLVARAGGFMRGPLALPAPLAWRGWYEAIEDLIDTLPDSQFAPWQLARLPDILEDSAMFGQDASQKNDGTGATYGVITRTHDRPAVTIKAAVNAAWYKAFIVEGQAGKHGEHVNVRSATDPIWTIAASQDKRPARALIIDSQNANQQWTRSYREENEPTMTIATRSAPRAYLVDSGNSSRRDYITKRRAEEPAITVTTDGRPSHAPRAWLEHGRVVAMTPRALARFQSMPDSYQLPDKKTLASRIIGNAVPPLEYQHLIEAIRPQV